MGVTNCRPRGPAPQLWINHPTASRQAAKGRTLSSVVVWADECDGGVVLFDERLRGRPSAVLLRCQVQHVRLRLDDTARRPGVRRDVGRQRLGVRRTILLVRGALCDPPRLQLAHREA
eukprot:2130478-Prymnesium_polylepis.1